MPYIPVEQRRACDGLMMSSPDMIVRLAKESGSGRGLCRAAESPPAPDRHYRSCAGGCGRMRYSLIAMLTGVFKNIADEFYRRLAAP